MTLASENMRAASLRALKHLGKLGERDQGNDQEDLAAKHPADDVGFDRGNVGAKFGLRSFELSIYFLEARIDPGDVRLEATLDSRDVRLEAALDSRDVRLEPALNSRDVRLEASCGGSQIGLVGKLDLRGDDFADHGFGLGTFKPGSFDPLDCGERVEMHVHRRRPIMERPLNPVRRWLAGMVLVAGLVVGSVAATAQSAPQGSATPSQMQSAGQDGSQFGKDQKEASAAIPDQTVSGAVVPGYQPAPQGLTSLFGSSDSALNGQAGAFTNGDAWQLTRSADANRGRVDAASLNDIRDRADQINENAGALTGGVSPSGQQGSCQKVTKPATQVFYPATCDVGLTTTTTTPIMQYACPAGWTLSGQTCSFTSTQPANVSYSCPGGGTLSGTSCISSQPASVSYSCPAGYSLSGSTCSQTLTQPASVSYSCPNGGTLSGTSCTSSQPATIAGYTCPSGFGLSGTSCTQILTQAATVSGYSCPSGYTVSGSTCVRTLQQSATPVYSCPAGWTLSGTTCNSSSSYAATPNYSCPSGYQLSGASCSQTLTQPAASSQTCPSGYVLNNGTCAMQTSYVATATSTCPAGWTLGAGQCAQSFSYAATVVYTCPANFHLEGNACWTNRYQCGTASSTVRWTIYGGSDVCGLRAAEISGGCSALSKAKGADYVGQAKLWNDTYCLYKPITNYQCPKSYTDAPNALCPAYSYYSTAPATSYDCPNGGTLSGTTCSGTNYVGTGIDYSCPNGGMLSGTTCLVDQTTTPTVIYSCAGGYVLSGTTCTLTNTQGASVSYSCPAGGTLSGTNCAITNSQAANVSYSCPGGYDLSGTTCTSTDTQTATPVYTCPVGYDLSGATCSKTNVQPATAQYACPSSVYNLAGTTCSLVTSATANYSCPSGYSLSGTTCSQTNTRAADPNYSCPANYSLSGTSCTLTTAGQPNYSCPVDYTLSGQTCSQTLTQAASGTLVCSDSAATLQDGQCYGTAAKTTCDQLASNPQCTFVKDTCLDEVEDGACKVTERTYSCPVPGEQGPPNSEYVCSGDIYCVDGSCQQVERSASNELKDALVALSAIDQAHKEFDPNNLDMFRGTRETCHQPLFGTVDCCAGKVSGLLSGATAAAGWAALGSGGISLLAGVATQSLTVFLCSNSEKQLDVKDRLGLCHFVGSYCSSSFLGVCSTKKKAYCCFESKLSRILQEQGRPQIGKPWAKPKDEQCHGFTVDEFSKLDLSKMDFSEIYSEFLGAAKLPDEMQVASDIQAKIQSYYQQNGVGGN